MRDNNNQQQWSTEDLVDELQRPGAYLDYIAGLPGWLARTASRLQLSRWPEARLLAAVVDRLGLGVQRHISRVRGQVATESHDTGTGEHAREVSP